MVQTGLVGSFLQAQHPLGLPVSGALSRATWKPEGKKVLMQFIQVGLLRQRTGGAGGRRANRRKPHARLSILIRGDVQDPISVPVP